LAADGDTTGVGAAPVAPVEGGLITVDVAAGSGPPASTNTKPMRPMLKKRKDNM
jgi:hypothetical protein